MVSINRGCDPFEYSTVVNERYVVLCLRYSRAQVCVFVMCMCSVHYLILALPKGHAREKSDYGRANFYILFSLWIPA